MQDYLRVLYNMLSLPDIQFNPTNCCIHIYWKNVEDMKFCLEVLNNNLIFSVLYFTSIFRYIVTLASKAHLRKFKYKIIYIHKNGQKLNMFSDR